MIDQPDRGNGDPDGPVGMGADHCRGSLPSNSGRDAAKGIGRRAGSLGRRTDRADRDRAGSPRHPGRRRTDPAVGRHHPDPRHGARRGRHPARHTGRAVGRARAGHRQTRQEEAWTQLVHSATIDFLGLIP